MVPVSVGNRGNEVELGGLVAAHAIDEGADYRLRLFLVGHGGVRDVFADKGGYESLAFERLVVGSLDLFLSGLAALGGVAIL